ncbi:hypothetical protein PAESOLCIP111_04898 [Paenibacillus solanacearum]|uniref:Uncharacterized protein n=1 Tax=Paenibacillus solanacearum TaxID=2048548 RepID=A0A916K8W8_9BACL|nr:hypothetical protein [Paenibacillus solanacearum]CAG7645184.1 hypothetical protein PAESOLCIP111_04898 [Paenibacillus solanacearum]
MRSCSCSGEIISGVSNPETLRVTISLSDQSERVGIHIRIRISYAMNCGMILSIKTSALRFRRGVKG